MLDSDKVDRALRVKMKAECLNRGDLYYRIYNDQGTRVGSTIMSKGPKYSLGPGRVSKMARQLGLDTREQFVELVKCTLSREDALKIMEAKGSKKIKLSMRVWHTPNTYGLDGKHAASPDT